MEPIPPSFSPLLYSPRDEDGMKSSISNFVFHPWGMPESPPNPRKTESLDSPRNNKLFGNWVQDKDGQMISYWDKQISSSILFSPLMPKTILEEQTVDTLPSFTDPDNHDDDIGIMDGLAPFRFEFDSDGEEETGETNDSSSEAPTLSTLTTLTTRLQQLGYPPALCQQALSKHGNNLDAALRWLSSCAPSLNSIGSLNSLNSLNSLKGSTSNLWATPSSSSSSSSSSSTPLSLSSSAVVPQEEAQPEYFTYTHNVKNNKQLSSSLGFSSRTSPINSNLLSIPIIPFSPSASINNPTDDSALAPDYYDLSKKQTCRYFLSGFCKNGDKCSFLHPSTTSHSAQGYQPAVSTPVSASPPVNYSTPTNMACRYYLSGFCRKGANCPYLHATSISPSSTPATTPPRSTRPITPTPSIPFPSLLSPASNSTPTNNIPFPTLLSTPSVISNAGSSQPFLTPSPCPSPTPSSSASSPPTSNLSSSPLPFPTVWDSLELPNTQQVLESLRQSSGIAANGPSPAAHAPVSYAASTTRVAPRVQPVANKQEAQRFFRIGIRHYHECEFDKALNYFTQSYQVYPSKESQAMIAKTLEFKRDDEGTNRTGDYPTRRDDGEYDEDKSNIQSRKEISTALEIGSEDVRGSVIDRATHVDEKEKLINKPIDGIEFKRDEDRLQSYGLKGKDSDKEKGDLAAEKKRVPKLHDAERQEKAAGVERKMAEKKEAEKKEVEKKETERKETETKEAEKKEEERKEAERKQAERKEVERREAEKKEVERREIEKKGVEKKEAERKEAERKEAERKEAERKEAERKEAERKEAERKEAERKEAERKEAERKEAERKEAERREAEKKATERKEALRKEAQRSAEKKEADRKEAERKEIERKEAERREAERKEAEKKEVERKEAERKEAERKEADRKERERVEKEKKEKEKKEEIERRREKERKDKERADLEKREKDLRDKEIEERARKETELKEPEASFGVAGVPGKAEFSSDLLPELVSDDDENYSSKSGKGKRKDRDVEDNGKSSMDKNIDSVTKLVKKIRNATNYYDILDIPQDADSETIHAQYKVIMQILHTSEETGASLAAIVKQVTQAYTFLADAKKRMEYDNQQQEDSEDSMAPHYGGFIDSARMFMSMVVLAVIALALFGKQAVCSLWHWLSSLAVSGWHWFWPSSHRSRSRKAKGDNWCQSCRVYHPASPVTYSKDTKEGKEGKEGDEEGSFWEEGGRYFFLQGSTKHDVTTIVHDRYWRTSPDNACHFCRAHARLDAPHTQTPQEEHDKSLAAKNKKKPSNNTNNSNTRKVGKRKKH